jgi:hypothetical protein
VYALLSAGLDLDGLLPDWLLPTADEASAAEGASVAARIAATLAVVEAVGPARLALTVAATPTVSESARQFAVVRNVEAWALDTWSRVSGGKQ